MKNWKKKTQNWNNLHNSQLQSDKVTYDSYQYHVAQSAFPNLTIKMSKINSLMSVFSKYQISRFSFFILAISYKFNFFFSIFILFSFLLILSRHLHKILYLLYGFDSITGKYHTITNVVKYFTFFFYFSQILCYIAFSIQIVSISWLSFHRVSVKIQEKKI